MTENITVENIKCGGCMYSIKTALLKIANVQEISIDKETETINISSALSLDRELLISQLSYMCYPEIGNNNLLLKAKSFLSCAIGNLS
jgi:copper chaperone